MNFALRRERLFSASEEQSTMYSNDGETQEYDGIYSDSDDDLMMDEEVSVGEEEYYDAPEVVETNVHRRRAATSWKSMWSCQQKSFHQRFYYFEFVSRRWMFLRKQETMLGLRGKLMSVRLFLRFAWAQIIVIRAFRQRNVILRNVSKQISPSIRCS